MPVKGIIKVIKYDDRIENMEVGASGFIEIHEAVVTRKAIFISIFAEVHDENEDGIPLLPVKRIGPGLTSDDFEIDYTNVHEDDMPNLDTYATYLDLIKTKKQYVVFEEFDIEYSKLTYTQNSAEDNQFSEGTEEIEEKKRELEQAEKDEDFEKASKLRDEIIALQKKIK